MFVKAIDIAAHFTRPIHTIVRNYESNIVVPGAASLFFVNAEGYALTCARVAKVLVAAEELGKKRQAFLAEGEKVSGTFLSLRWNRAVGQVGVLGYGFERAKLGSPPYPVRFDDAGEGYIAAWTLDEFVSLAGVVLDEVQATLEAQPRLTVEEALPNQAVERTR